MRFSYTTEHLDFLRMGYPKMMVPELTIAFNQRFNMSKAESHIKAALKNHHFQSGRKCQFKKGNKSWNKGVKGYMGPNKTSFKKGAVPPNRRPLYSERICSKDGFVLIKVPETNPHTGFPTRFRHKHVWVWEQKYGPVPKGMVVFFLDSDKRNCDPENLIILSRAELLLLNRRGYHDLPTELRPSMLALAKLTAKVGELKRKKI